jgi:hypothetical protein
VFSVDGGKVQRSRIVDYPDPRLREAGRLIKGRKIRLPASSFL